MARVLVLDVRQDEIRESDCTELDDFYRELNAKCFDIARRNVGGKYYDIFVDDIGLFQEDPIISAVSRSGDPMLVGNLVFANHDGTGETTGLTNEDVARIFSQMVKVRTQKYPQGYRAIMCEY